MSSPVRLSDELVLDARLAGQAVHRSISGQVEFWANLGRGIEPLLLGRQAIALCRSSAAKSLSDCLESADSPQGRDRVGDFLRTRPYPHYEPAPGGDGRLVRIDADGKRTLGRFVNREFRPAESEAPPR